MSSRSGTATPPSRESLYGHTDDSDKVVGWLLFAGTMVLIAAFSIWAGNEYGRWIGIGSAAGLNSIVMLMFIPAYPFGALAVFAIDVLVIYGLAAYGGRSSASA